MDIQIGCRQLCSVSDNFYNVRSSLLTLTMSIWPRGERKSRSLAYIPMSLFVSLSVLSHRFFLPYLFPALLSPWVLVWFPCISFSFCFYSSPWVYAQPFIIQKFLLKFQVSSTACLLSPASGCSSCSHNATNLTRLLSV